MVSRAVDQAPLVHDDRVARGIGERAQGVLARVDAHGEVGREADEPGVARLVGRPGLARQRPPMATKEDKFGVVISRRRASGASAYCTVTATGPFELLPS